MDEPGLTVEQLKVIAGFVDQYGELGAAERLGVHVTTLLRVLAGRPNVRRGSFALLRESLGRLQGKVSP